MKAFCGIFARYSFNLRWVNSAMALLSLLIALMLDQIRPAVGRYRIWRPLTRYANYFERHFNAGEYRQGMVAWLLAVVPLLLLIWGIFLAASHTHALLGVLVNVLVLFLVMGLRQFSHPFTSINTALQHGDVVQARQILQQWSQQDTQEFSSEEVARVAIEQALLHAHRYVFGVMFWFVLLPGPSGALLYWLAALLRQKWVQPVGVLPSAFGEFAEKVFVALEWLPVRLSAVSFAIVGNFEDAVYCWRSQATQWVSLAQGILLSAGAGALGVRLGDPLHQGGEVFYRPELGLGDMATSEYLQSTVGLIWRAVVLWLLFIALFSLTLWLA